MADGPSTRLSLVPDCASCFGLCCVALPFAASADFPVDKPGGQPCTNLQTDFRCGIHARLRESGWKGCTVFDCFGAGQQVSQVTFGGVSWRDAPGTAATMYAVLPVMRQLHEMLSHLGAALAMSPGSTVEGELAALLEEVEDLTAATPEALLALDLTALRARVGPLLQRTSAAVRAEARRAGRAPKTAPRRIGPVPTCSGWTCMPRTCGRPTCGAPTSSPPTCAAATWGRPTSWARTCAMRTCATPTSPGALFLTQPQLGAARGNAATAIPRSLRRPDHWA